MKATEGTPAPNCVMNNADMTGDALDEGPEGVSDEHPSDSSGEINNEGHETCDGVTDSKHSSSSPGSGGPGDDDDDDSSSHKIVNNTEPDPGSAPVDDEGDDTEDRAELIELTKVCGGYSII